MPISLVYYAARRLVRLLVRGRWSAGAALVIEILVIGHRLYVRRRDRRLPQQRQGRAPAPRREGP